jgi:hypothetical protein
MGHPAMSTKVPEKPEALVRYQQCKLLGLQLVEGGLLDQPHIWLQEVAVVAETEALYNMLPTGDDDS